MVLEGPQNPTKFGDLGSFVRLSIFKNSLKSKTNQFYDFRISLECIEYGSETLFSVAKTKEKSQTNKKLKPSVSVQWFSNITIT